ncbi:hypothetical protein H0O02_00795, partial [Candidatus Micrarchaeota archaeon]|nr:hypothetical protein [Candidatus Micrarchaeota archaeon]
MVNFQYKSKKGFLFVVTIFLLLTYILLSISVWVKAIEASERTYSELYKESSVELIIEQLTPAKISEISDIVMTRAVFKMNKHSIDHPIREGPAGDEYYYIEKSMLEYLQNGSPSADNFDDGIAPIPEYDASLGGWMRSLNASLLAIGASIDNFEIYDYSFKQEALDRLNYSFKIKLSLRDTAGTTTISRTYDVNGKINVTGFVDPAIARETSGHQTIYRQFFFYPAYSSPAAVSPDRIGGIEAGQGWFYGQLASASEAATVPAEHRGRYILVGSYSEITGLDEEVTNGFSAYILTSDAEEGGTCTRMSETYTGERNTFNALTYSGVTCTVGIDPLTVMLKPYVIAPGFSISSAPDCPDLARGITRKCVLFVAEHEPSYVQSHPETKLSAPTASTGIFDMENMRDYALCGYYIPYAEAPSYLQRLLPNSYNK